MTAYERALQLYRDLPGCSSRGLDADILDFAKTGYAHLSPERIILARPWSAHESWHVYLAVGGGVEEFVKMAPFPMQYVTFYRPGKTGDKLHKLSFQKLKSRLCYTDAPQKCSSGNTSAEDLALPLPRPSHPLHLMPQLRQVAPPPWTPADEALDQLSSLEAWVLAAREIVRRY